MNKVILVGNLTKEPDQRRTKTDKVTTRMSIAVNQGYGENQKTDFFNLVAWEKTAELCGKYLSKGSKVLVEGILRNNNYEKDGVKHYGVDVIVSSIEFLDSKKKAANTEDFDGENVSDDDMPF